MQEDSESDLDDENEGGEWVTPDNLNKHILGGDAIEVKPKVV